MMFGVWKCFSKFTNVFQIHKCVYKFTFTNVFPAKPIKEERQEIKFIHACLFLNTVWATNTQHMSDYD